MGTQNLFFAAKQGSLKTKKSLKTPKTPGWVFGGN
jgi:hypothetical protein